MRHWSDAENTGKQVGFKLVTAYDAATIAIGPNRPWFERLTQFRHLHYVDDVIVKVLGGLRLIPRTLIDVHTMLVRVAKSLVEGGESGVFTPMYMMCFEKPDTKQVLAGQYQDEAPPRAQVWGLFLPGGSTASPSDLPYCSQSKMLPSVARAAIAIQNAGLDDKEAPLTTHE
eukprot:TRINITY_DN10269_c0_g2_i1.p2 TRINITY_DN10269_c0_g2~~TRINITY_DN10269_c0_g2_i1.p2  ORF type:complete len:172 (+),score=13.50 TRINITY_DN10269_c0_g2_i1:2-517(+)